MRGVVRDFTRERAAAPTHPHANASTALWGVRERDGVLPFGQLQIELHIWNQRFQDFLEWWELLEVSGLRPFHNEVCHCCCCCVWLGKLDPMLIRAVDQFGVRELQPA